MQLVHDAAPAVAYCPAGHWDVVGDVDPAGQAYPDVQGPEQAAVVRPATAPYAPPGQGLHTPATAREYVPAGHMDVVELVDPAGQAYPAVQLPEQDAVVRPVVAP